MGKRDLATALALAVLFAGALEAQTTPEEKVANALSAAPDFIAAEAAVWDWPAEGEQPEVLRAGTNGWTCLPTPATAPANSPRCFDDVFLPAAIAAHRGQTPSVERIGLSYMLAGAGESLGPHIMIALPAGFPLSSAIGAFDGSGRPFKVGVVTSMTEIVMPIAGGGTQIQVVPHH